ncbi:hypothetical protein CcCBS67573_g00373 [Chytriomyces confervae]|uniref:Uncharacterized protein n=1 Tax=Chytriomyces confervae TaxID=246404 RepID=A0A507FPM6_9FUNG|nr:hypothetical protein CcCBS67573_g00373 [Chytriomyces confervae]
MQWELLHKRANALSSASHWSKLHSLGRGHVMRLSWPHAMHLRPNTAVHKYALSTHILWLRAAAAVDPSVRIPLTCLAKQGATPFSSNLLPQSSTESSNQSIPVSATDSWSHIFAGVTNKSAVSDLDHISSLGLHPELTKPEHNAITATIISLLSDNPFDGEVDQVRVYSALYLAGILLLKSDPTGPKPQIDSKAMTRLLHHLFSLFNTNAVYLDRNSDAYRYYMSLLDWSLVHPNVINGLLRNTTPATAILAMSILHHFIDTYSKVEPTSTQPKFSLSTSAINAIFSNLPTEPNSLLQLNENGESDQTGLDTKHNIHRQNMSHMASVLFIRLISRKTIPVHVALDRGPDEEATFHLFVNCIGFGRDGTGAETNETEARVQSHSDMLRDCEEMQRKRGGVLFWEAHVALANRWLEVCDRRWNPSLDQPLEKNEVRDLDWMIGKAVWHVNRAQFILRKYSTNEKRNVLIANGDAGVVEAGKIPKRKLQDLEADGSINVLSDFELVRSGLVDGKLLSSAVNQVLLARLKILHAKIRLEPKRAHSGITPRQVAQARKGAVQAISRVVLGEFGSDTFISGEVWTYLGSAFGAGKLHVVRYILEEQNKNNVHVNVTKTEEARTGWRILANQTLGNWSQEVKLMEEENGGNSGDSIPVAELFRSISERSLRDSVTVTILVRDALERLKDTEVARQIYNEAHQDGLFRKGDMDLYPSLHLMLKMYADEGNEDGTKWVLGEFARNDIPENHTTITLLVTALARRGKWSQATSFYDEYRNNGGTVDTIFFQAIAKVVSDQGQPWAVDEWIGRMKECGLPVTSVMRYYAIQALVYNHRGQYPDLKYLVAAENQLDLMEVAFARNPRGMESVATPYSLIMKGYAKVQNVLKVNELMNRFTSKYRETHTGLPGLTLTFILCLVDCNQWSEAKEYLLQSRCDWGMDEQGYFMRSVATLVQNASMSDLPYPSNPELETLAASADVSLLRSFGLQPFIHTELDTAVIIGRIQRTPHRLQAVSTYALDYWKARQRTSTGFQCFRPQEMTRIVKATRTAVSAEEWLNEFEKMEPSTSGDLILQSAYLSICALDHNADVLKALQRVLDRVLKPPSGIPSQEWCDSIAAMYTTVAGRCARDGNAEAVERLLTEVKEHTGNNTSVLRQKHFESILLNAYGRSRQIDRADALWRDCVEKSPTGVAGLDESIVCLRLDSFGFRGDLSGLEDAWNMLVQLADENVQGSTTRFFLTENHCNSYIEALIRLGKFELAVNVAKCVGQDPNQSDSVEVIGRNCLSRISPTPKMLRTVETPSLNWGMDRRSADSPSWLVMAKKTLVATSPAVAILRERIAEELRARLIALSRSRDTRKLREGESPVTPHVLGSMRKHDRDALLKGIADALLSEGIRSDSILDNEDEYSLRSLWTDIRKAADATLDDQLGVAVAATLMQDRQFSGSDSLQAKLKLALKESEMGIMSLLNKWPDSRISLRGCVNVPLSRDLRRVAWLTCLSDEDTVKDFYKYINSDRVTKNAALVDSQLFNICQSLLGSNPLLYPLASQFRVLKRMEQALAFLIHESSIPHLRKLKLDMKPIAKLSASSDPPTPHPEFSKFHVLEEGSLRRRQMLFMVPFLKVLELDDSDVAMYASQSKPQKGSDEVLDEDAEFVHVAAKAAEGESKDWLNVFHANEHMTKRRKCGIGIDVDQARTARLAEVVGRFWAVVPMHWREEGDAMVQIIAGDVETFLSNEDTDLHAHLGRLLAQNSLPHDFSGFSNLVKHLVGDAFVGKCSLGVLCYIFDQLIIASFESTQDDKFPSMDALCAWMCGSMILLMRDKIMNCETVADLMALATVQQTALTVGVLSTTLEVHFLSKFRKSLLNVIPVAPPFIDLPDHIFGFDGSPQALLPVEKKSPEMYAKLGLHLTNARRLKDGLSPVGEDGAHEIGENDLILAEMEEYALLKEFYIVKKRKERRLRELMRKWKTLSRCLGLWAIYFKRVHGRIDAKLKIKQEKARIEAERLHRIQLEEELARQLADQELAREGSLLSKLFDQSGYDQNHVFGIWGGDLGENEDDDGFNIKKPQDAFALTDDPLFAEEVRRQEALRLAELEEAERRRNQLKKPEFVQQTMMVTLGTYVGEEQLHLTPLGKTLRGIFDKIQYVLQGYFSFNSTTMHLMAHALSFQQQFEKDVASVLKPAVRSGSIMKNLGALRPRKLNHVLDTVEKHRVKRLKESIDGNLATADDEKIMLALEDKAYLKEASDYAPEVQVVKAKAKSTQGRITNRLPGVILNVLDRLQIVIDGEKETRDASWHLSLQAEQDFKQAEREAWQDVMDRPFNEGELRELLSGGLSSSQRERFVTRVEEILQQST